MPLSTDNLNLWRVLVKSRKQVASMDESESSHV